MIEFPIVKGTIRSAKGYLGAFEISVDDYAVPSPSSRDALAFGTASNGAVSRCDILLDLSGGTALFPAADLRDGYVRANTGDPAAVLKAVLRARDLVGGFDKPRYIRSPKICAHIRGRVLSAVVASTSARPEPSHLTATMLRSTPISAPVVANAPPSVRPAPRATRCRPPTR